MNRTHAAILLGLFLCRTSVAAPIAREAITGPPLISQSTDDITALPGGAPLTAELESSLDSKKAKVGDQVVARTTESLKTNGKVLLAKNTKLIGHVTQSLARSKGDPSSSLTIQFDKAIIKKGQEIPIRVVIQAMAAAPRTSLESSPDPSAMPPGTAAAQGSPMGTTRQPPPGTTPNGGRPEATGSSAPDNGRTGNSANGANAGLDNAGRLTPNSQGIIGLDGLHLATDQASAAQGSMITTSGKSVHLDSGIRLLLIAQ